MVPNAILVGDCEVPCSLRFQHIMASSSHAFQLSKQEGWDLGELTTNSAAV